MSCSDKVPPPIDGCKPIRRRPTMRFTGICTFFNRDTGKMEVQAFDNVTKYQFTLTGKSLETCRKRGDMRGKGVTFKI